MCGIAGVLFRDGRPVDRTALGRMAGALAHRGPDGEGLYVASGVPSVGLASRRLAVIDVTSGAQPMTTEDGRYTVVYNGEVFNAGELRDELAGRGHRFRTRCDTEVVLQGYAEWGAEVVGRLNGMWAFAVWDASERRVFLSRDRLGVKPLVYADTPDALVFASEIKALLASGWVARTPDLTALPHYLSTFVVPEPHSFFHGIRRLPAGHFAIADASGVREQRYWDCAFEEEPDRGLAAYEGEVRALLEDSVRRRLVSDVPLGVFLSGGIDSALVATLSARALASPLRTFTLGFEGSPADERPAARRLARSLGADHTEDVITGREAAAVLPDALVAHDEPSQSLVQSFFVSRLARRQVTVALAGTGGDELFSSYPTHRVVDALARLDRLPSALRGLALAAARWAGGRRGGHLAALAALPPDDRVSGWLMQQTDRDTRSKLIAPELRATLDLDAPARHLEMHYARARAHHPLNRVLYVYTKTYLPDELLRTLDTMSMAHSLEARVPLLDYRLVERAMSIPARHKMSWREGKLLLRRVAAHVLPPGTLRAGKRGFSVPLDLWLRGELAEALRDVLSESAVRRRGIFHAPTVQALLNRYLDGDARLVQPVMMLFAFEQWARRVLDEPATPTTETPGKVSGPAPELSVIVVNWNTRELLRAGLQSLREHLASVPHEVLVVDNGSADGSPAMVARDFPWVRLVRNAENVGFARANNQAMRLARGRWFLLLNSDAALVDDTVATLFRRVREQEGLGVAHCRLTLADGRLQYSTYRFPSLGLALLENLGLYKLLPAARRADALLAGYWDHSTERDVDWVSGAFMLLPRAVFDQTRGFSEEYFMYGEDMEWCYRIRQAGWRIRYYPQASVRHQDHGSSDQRWGERRIAICIRREIEIYRKQHGVLAGSAFTLVKTLGSLMRVVYFGVGALIGGRQRDYYRTMTRYHALSLRVHAALASGQR